mgnify:CR=1 FL=1|tara:strand:- start:178 stop:597 length:420 start_codon:yes stop_codon:yes gene_type:complete
MNSNLFCSHTRVFPISFVLGRKRKPYKITKEVRYVLSNGMAYTVEKGFRLDGTSVPKVFRSIMPRINNKIIGSTLHDHMYINDYLRKELGDKKARKFIDKEMLLFWNKYDPKKKIENKIMYLLVRTFGRKIFNKYKKVS